MPDRITDADLCRQHGWGPGTRITNHTDYGTRVLRITAVGEKRIFAVYESLDGVPADTRELAWSLQDVEWHEASHGD